MAYDFEEQEKLDALKAWWAKYGTPILAVLALVLLGFAAWNGWNWYQRREATTAMVHYEALEKAAREGNVNQVRDASGTLLDKYGRTAYAPRAALLAAHAFLEAGDRKAATDQLQWVVDKSATTVEARGIQNADKSYVQPDPAIAKLVAEEHAATIAYVQTPVGATDFRMSTYFADVGDVSAIEVVNQAQAGYLAAYVKANLSQYASLPVLSMSSPFKSGSAGVSDYTDVKAGNVALNNAADLYLYPNALYGVKMNGADLKAWLEQSAQRFNTIDPNKAEAQELVNTAHPSYNFDAITSADVRYQIDVTQKPGQRIKGLTYKGKPVGAAQEFLIATNNYRASGGGNFPGLDGSKTVVASPDNNRELLIAYVTKEKNLTRAKNGSARSWRFARVATQGPVVFHSAPNVIDLAKAAGIDNVTQLKLDDGAGKGFALYQLDLSK